MVLQRIWDEFHLTYHEANVANSGHHVWVEWHPLSFLWTKISEILIKSTCTLEQKGTNLKRKPKRHQYLNQKHYIWLRYVDAKKVLGTFKFIMMITDHQIVWPQKFTWHGVFWQWLAWKKYRTMAEHTQNIVKIVTRFKQK